MTYSKYYMYLMQRYTYEIWNTKDDASPESFRRPNGVQCRVVPSIRFRRDVHHSRSISCCISIYKFLFGQTGGISSLVLRIRTPYSVVPRPTKSQKHGVKRRKRSSTYRSVIPPRNSSIKIWGAASCRHNRRSPCLLGPSIELLPHL